MAFELIHSVVFALVAFGVAYALIKPVRALAVKLDAVDYPNARRVNTYPVPRMGGLAIAGGTAAALLMELAAERWLGLPPIVLDGSWGGVDPIILIAGFVAAVAVGAIDDCHALSPKVKLAGQTLAALLIACSGVLLAEVKNPFAPGFIEFGVFAYPITVVYLLLFMNAINLIDGLDGLCAGIVAIALGTLIVISIGKGKFEIVMLSAILLGGVLAFLRFNIRPASIFMGDSGSLFLGLSLGVLSLVGVMRTPYIAVLLAPLVVATIPLLDTLGAVVRRLRRHQSFDVADKSHIHHKLMATSLSNERIVYLLWAWTGILGCLAIMISSSSNLKTLIVVLVAFVVTFVVFWQLGVFGPALTHHFDKRFKGSSSVLRALNRLGSGSKDKNDGDDAKGDGGERPCSKQ